jgi:hypothetical protein
VELGAGAMAGLVEAPARGGGAGVVVEEVEEVEEGVEGV